MKKLTTKEFKEIVYDFEKEQNFSNKQDKPIIIDFYADWCGPCKVVAPILEDLEKEGTFTLYKVDTDEEYDLSSYFNIRSIPTLIFVPKKGNPVAHMGAYPKGEIKKLINKYFAE
jgi:thioredoxin